jgi:2-polyprenyl-3-methyl-5-hydroxy-6-metoxy-1,4-benzoquinol methylase
MSRINEEKKALEGKYGPWTAHNISLGDDAFTIRNEVSGNEVKLRRVMQIIADVFDRPISDLRVLDLACFEGGYAIEFSRQGAHVCAIEGRKANLEKSRFAARALSLGDIEFYQDDVRNLTEERYGEFDVVLCLGILYHLNTPDVFTFLENVFAVCRRVAVIDTHISLYSEETFLHNGRRYMGKTVPEHARDASPEEIEKSSWASLDNPTSAYFTRPSLYSLLYDLGFTSVYECHIPQWPDKPKDRVTLLAIKGTPVPLVSCPQLVPEYARELPDESTPPALRPIRPGLQFLGWFLPRGFKQFVRRVLFPEKTN